MLPRLRTKLKNVSSKNRSLQDILGSSSDTRAVKSIEPHEGGIHNAKLILESSNGIQRVQFYNRLDLAVILNGIEIEATTIEDIIDELNLKGFDFNEDDLEIVEAKLTAKETSIGYIGSFALAEVEVIEPPPSHEINCDGALPVATPVYTEGEFELVIDGTLLGTGTIEELRPVAEANGIMIVPSVDYNLVEG